MESGTALTRLTQWFRELNPWVLDACLGTVFTVLGLIGLFGASGPKADYHPVDAFGVVLALACSLPYFFRRRAPVPVLLTNVVALCTLAIVGYPSNVQSQMLLIGIYTVGSHAGRRGRLLGMSAVAIGLVTVAAAGIVDATTSNLLLSGAVYAGAYLFGSTVRNRRLYLGELEARARELERERDEEARRAVSEERLRIAQELHDVVAHSMGVIAVQAGVGAHVIDDDPAEAKRSLEAIAGTSRSTLTEIRRLLGVLRNDGAADYQPAPGLADLGHLAAELDAAGLPVAIEIEGDASEIPPGVDLTAYRIVQEALTNVLKHAGPAHARVTVAYRPGMVTLRVTDDGRGVNGSSSGGGHGLLGMRERVGVYGGTLAAGPQTGGGFRVVAELPYGDAQ
jgi:signal transduction histidine kinase